jgi:cytochrome c-type biogenesis protein CcmH/NrfG
VALLREAVTLNPNAPRYHLLLGTTLAAHPKMQREAEQSLKKAAELDQFNPAPLVALGQLYARANMNLQAEKMFNEALRLDPDSKAARKGLDAIKSNKSGGFLDKLFKK